MHSLALLSSLLSLTSAASIFSRQSTACNNSPDLCSKSYSSITHLGAHDSPFVRDASNGFTVSGNQYYNTTVQLSAGVRLVSAQVHSQNGGWHLCHSSCDLLDAGTLSSWLGEIKTWLDANPNEVVTVLLVNSDSMTAEELHTQFTEANLVDYAYKPPSSNAAPQSWPTLQELINQNTRLMTFIASMDPSQVSSETSYLMDEFTFIFENSYQNTKASDFKCTPDRPSAVKGQTSAAIQSNRMPLMNHFLYAQGLFDIETPNSDEVANTNSPDSSKTGSLAQAFGTCKTEYGKAPTFVLVDFFDQGPAVNAVDALNGITNAVGRTSPPPRDTSSDLSDRLDGSFGGVMQLVEQVKLGKTPSQGAWIWGSGKWSWGGVNFNGGDLVG